MKPLIEDGLKGEATDTERLLLMMLTDEFRSLYLLLEILVNIHLLEASGTQYHIKHSLREIEFDFDNKVKGVYGDYAKLLMQVRDRSRRKDSDPESDPAYG
jgi:hypothetical protein